MSIISEKISSLINVEKSANIAEKSQQLANFIDQSLAQAYMFDGNDRAKVLVTALLTMRDYLAKDIYENSVRANILNEVLGIVSLEEAKLVQEEKASLDNEVEKKELES